MKVANTFFTQKLELMERSQTGSKIVPNTGTVETTFKCSHVFPDDTDFDTKFKTDAAEARWLIYVQGDMGISPNRIVRVNDILYTIERINPWKDHDFTELKLILTPDRYKVSIN